MNERIPTDRIPGSGELQFPMPVIDLDHNTEIEFSPVGWYWGPVERYEGRSIFEESFDYTFEEHLFLHPGSSNYWTILTVSTHGEFGNLGTPEVQRLSDEAAARWFVTNGINIPDELNQFRKKLVFQPGPPADPQLEAKHATPAVSTIKPQWDSELRQLTMNGEIIRQLGHRATQAEKIVQAFEEDGWPHRIESPFPASEAGSTTRREAIRSLNHGLLQIRFVSDGSREGIVWELLQE